MTRQPDPQSEILLNARQLAELLGVCQRSVFNLTARPGFPASIRLGRSRRWLRREVLDFLERKAPRDKPPRRTVSRNS